MSSKRSLKTPIIFGTLKALEITFAKMNLLFHNEYLICSSDRNFPIFRINFQYFHSFCCCYSKCRVCKIMLLFFLRSSSSENIDYPNIRNLFVHEISGRGSRIYFNNWTRYFQLSSSYFLVDSFVFVFYSVFVSDVNIRRDGNGATAANKVFGKAKINTPK